MMDQNISVEQPTYIEGALNVKKSFDEQVPSGQWCMYFWIPTSIHMKKGKMSGQVAHASARLARKMKEFEWDQYIQHEVKIIYKVDTINDLIDLEWEFQLDNLEYVNLVFDNTWETLTVLGIATKRKLKDKKWKLA